MVPAPDYFPRSTPTASPGLRLAYRLLQLGHLNGLTTVDEGLALDDRLLSSLGLFVVVCRIGFKVQSSAPFEWIKALIETGPLARRQARQSCLETLNSVMMR